jgi:hypothetical protein
MINCWFRLSKAAFFNCLGYVVLNGTMIWEWQIGKDAKGRNLDLKALSQHLNVEAKKNHEQPVSWPLGQGSPEYKADVITSQLQHSVCTDKFINYT